MKILVADDDAGVRHTLMRALKQDGRDVESVVHGKAALERAATTDLLLADLSMPEMDGLELLYEARQVNPAIEVIIITGHGTVSTAVEAMKKGARTYLCKPLNMDELHRCIEEVETIVGLRKAANRAGRGDLVGGSHVMREVYAEIDIAAVSDLPVLIGGETGTGKDLAAQAIHQLSVRKHGPFIAVNLGAIPGNLAEGELFGYEKGAFTGAASSKKGRFQIAQGGTILLDEVDSLALDLQPKLLRAIEEKKIWPLGSEKPIDVDIRIVAATNAHLEKLVEGKEFRDDLFYRLNVIQIHMPALNEHGDDIPQIVQALLDRLPAAEAGIAHVSVTPDALAQLMVRRWPGNVRQLSNALERAFARASARRPHKTSEAMEIDRSCFDFMTAERNNMSFRAARANAADTWAEKTVRGALAQADGNVSEAARRLKMSRTGLIRLLEKYDIPHGRQIKKKPTTVRYRNTRPVGA